MTDEEPKSYSGYKVCSDCGSTECGFATPATDPELLKELLSIPVKDQGWHCPHEPKCQDFGSCYYDGSFRFDDGPYGPGC